MGASCEEEPPISVSGAVALNEKTISLVFGAISMVNSSKKTKKKARAFLFLRRNLKKLFNSGHKVQWRRRV